MDAILQYLNAAAGYASVVLLTIVVGVMYLALTYPALWFWTAVVALLYYATRKSRRIRRLMNWYVWWPLRRSIDRLIVPARRRMVRYLMCKVKKSVLADKLDDCLQQMVTDKHISRHEYANLCYQIGVALDLTDIIPRGKRFRHVTEMLVKKNCADTKAAVPAGLKIPGAPEPAEPGHQELHYLRKRNVA